MTILSANLSPRVLSRRLSHIAWYCLALVLAACGGSSTQTSTPPVQSCSSSTCGPAVLTLTDAKGDFLSYIVTLTSLQLQTAKGTSVETLAAPTKVDFAQLVDLREIVSSGPIPVDEYVAAKMTLDYTGAKITADDGTGTPVTLKPVDASGNALTAPLTMTVTLDSNHHLLITAGNTARLALDFNLPASNTVDLPAGTVTVTPTLVASLTVSDTRKMRIRGNLVSIDAAHGNFVLNVLPFYDDTKTMGQMNVQVTSTTGYEINGKTYAGTDGINALAGLSPGTVVAAFGTLSTATTATPTFSATSVLAGNSLESATEDLVTGTVIARNGMSLTVRGATLVKPDHSFDFMTSDVTVTVGANTMVTEAGQIGTFTTAEISVGQHIVAFGTAATSANNTVSLDATAGKVRLDLTPVAGVVTAVGPGSVTLTLQSLGGYPSTAFNFAGTGTSSTNDANAKAYVVNTGTQDATGLSVGAPALLIGYVTPFGMAPPDFAAQQIVNFPALPDILAVDWGKSGSTTALTGLTASSTSLQLSLTNVGFTHFIENGAAPIDLTKLSAPPSIVPDTTATSDMFAIGHAGTFNTDNFSTFSSFISQLATDLNGTTAVVVLTATGKYDSTANTFTVTHVVVVLSH